MFQTTNQLTSVLKASFPVPSLLGKVEVRSSEILILLLYHHAQVSPHKKVSITIESTVHGGCSQRIQPGKHPQ